MEVYTLKKINISIPDELHSELEPYRDNLNLSAIFTKAIKLEIHLIRAVPKEVTDLQKAKRRLLESKELAEKDAFEVGFEVGKDWGLKVAEYVQVKDMVNRSSKLKKESWKQSTPWLPDYVFKYLEKNDVNLCDRYPKYNTLKRLSAFEQGFFESVKLIFKSLPKEDKTRCVRKTTTS
jgi:hypothetical protein